MSLFKAREWWSKRLVGAKEEFDRGSLATGPLDGNSSGADQVIVGSHSGFLRIFSPVGRSKEEDAEEEDDDQRRASLSAEDLWIEVDTKRPLLQVGLGRFVSGTSRLHLAVLHPRKLSVYALLSMPGAAALGSQWQLKVAYEHSLQRTAYNFCSGPFGQVSDRDFICVQAVDATLSVYEQDSFAFSRFLPDSLLPGPLVYLALTDCFLVVSSCRQLEAYKYQVLAVAADANSKEESQKATGKRVTADWVFNLGETAVDMQAVSTAEGQSTVVVLGRRHIFAVSEMGRLRFVKRVDYNALAIHIYGVFTAAQAATINFIVTTEGGELLIYRDKRLMWAAQMTHPAVAIGVGTFSGLKGMLVTVGGGGTLDCIYLGTEPCIEVAPTATCDLREPAYEDQDSEMQRLQSRIKSCTSDAPVLVASAKAESDIKIHVQPCTGLDRVSRAMSSLVEEGESSGQPRPSVTIAFSLKAKVPLNNVQVHVEARPPLTANQKQFFFSTLDPSHSGDCVVSLYVAAGTSAVPCELQARIIAVYSNIQGAPRVCQTSMALPLNLVVCPCLPVKQANCRITLDTNQSIANLNSIFPELLCEGGDPTGCALAFQYFGSEDDAPVVTVLASKTSQRYRLQSDSMGALWVLSRELIDRLSRHYGGGFKASFSEPLPLGDYFAVVDFHWAARARLIEMEALVNQRAVQYRSIQRRLLTRFKDKTPAPLVNLDTLLEGSMRQLVQLADMTAVVRGALTEAASALGCASSLLALLVQMSTNQRSEDYAVLGNVLSGLLEDHHPEMGIEEMYDTALTHLLRTVLSRSSAKDVQLSAPAFAMPSDTDKLKKHVTMLCEKAGRGVSLTPTVPSKPTPKENTRTAVQDGGNLQPVSIIQDAGAAEEMADAPTPDFRSPRSDKKKKKKHKKHRQKDNLSESSGIGSGGDRTIDSALSEDQLKKLPALRDISESLVFPEPLVAGDQSDEKFFG